MFPPSRPRSSAGSGQEMDLLRGAYAARRRAPAKPAGGASGARGGCVTTTQAGSGGGRGSAPSSSVALATRLGSTAPATEGQTTPRARASQAIALQMRRISRRSSITEARPPRSRRSLSSGSPKSTLSCRRRRFFKALRPRRLTSVAAIDCITRAESSSAASSKRAHPARSARPTWCPLHAATAHPSDRMRHPMVVPAHGSSRPGQTWRA